MAEIEQRGERPHIGTPLDQILEVRNQPPEATRLAILRGLAERLDAGDISGDVNPENIFISEDLSGANIAIALKDTGNRFVPEEELGADGRIPEAARYLSPERILGTSTDIRSHEFSLGVIAYEFVCGKKPFDAPDLPQLFYRVCTEKYIPVEEVDPKLSGKTSGVLSRALAKDRERRFPDCKSFVQALIVALRNEGEPAAALFHVRAAPAVETTGLSTTRLRRRYSDDEREAAPTRSRSMMFLLIAALCLVGLGLALFFLRYKPGPNLPVQVLDTNAGPVTPPPAADNMGNQSAHAKTRSRAPSSVAPPVTTQAPSAFAPVLKPFTAFTSDVEFLTDPPSAQVVVDDDPAKACTTPCTLSLPAGRHTLSASLSGFGRAQRIFNLPQDKSLFLTLSRRVGTLVITSAPSGSTVVVDGRNYGVTPVTAHLSPGEHRVLLINGARQHSDMVDVEADAIQAKAFTW